MLDRKRDAESAFPRQSVWSCEDVSLVGPIKVANRFSTLRDVFFFFLAQNEHFEDTEALQTMRSDETDNLRESKLSKTSHGQSSGKKCVFRRPTDGSNDDDVMHGLTVLYFTDWRELLEDESKSGALANLLHFNGVVLLDVARNCWLSNADVLWNDRVHSLVAKRKYLLETLAHVSTLGGGWASVGERKKAQQFAMRQKVVARKLEDETLELLSNVYIAYGILHDGDHDKAQRMIEEQAELVKKRGGGDARQRAIIEAAFIHLSRVRAAANQIR